MLAKQHILLRETRLAYYEAVLEYYDIVDSVDTMAILARKSKVDWQAAASDLDDYVKEPKRRKL